MARKPFTGKSTKQAVKPLRREGRNAPPVPVCSCAFFVCANRTRDRGCSKHPVFPAPSKFWRANEDANLGRSAPREHEGMSIVGWVERSETHHLSATFCVGIDGVSLRSTHPTGLYDAERSCPHPSKGEATSSEANGIAHQTGWKPEQTKCRIFAVQQNHQHGPC